MLNNNFIIFCELGSLDSIALSNLKNDFAKEGFRIKRIKNKVFKILYKNSKIYDLIGGPVFILYKNSIDSDKDMVCLKKLIGLDFILCCLFNNKVYLSPFLRSFKSFKFLTGFYMGISNTLTNILALNLYNNHIKQISIES